MKRKHNYGPCVTCGKSTSRVFGPPADGGRIMVVCPECAGPSADDESAQALRLSYVTDQCPACARIDGLRLTPYVLEHGAMVRCQRCRERVRFPPPRKSRR